MNSGDELLGRRLISNIIDQSLADRSVLGLNGPIRPARAFRYCRTRIDADHFIRMPVRAFLGRDVRGSLDFGQYAEVLHRCVTDGSFHLPLEKW